MGTRTLWNSSSPSTVRPTVARFALMSILASVWYFFIPCTSPWNIPDMVMEKSQPPEAAKIHPSPVLFVK